MCVFVFVCVVSVISLGTARMVVVVWRGRSSVNVMVNKVDCGFILSQVCVVGWGGRQLVVA